MTEIFSFDHLSDIEFEEFCFDLLKELDFKNINWRKGTGKTTSPSDSGRDIECKRFTKDVDGKITEEKWFFECKHYKKGLPPEKIQGALSWANAERPDKLVIVVSNFLSNPCKNYLETYIDENKPSFKIKYWEIKELEDLIFGKSKLLNKYKLSKGLDFLEIMHPMHIKYISKPNNNSLDYFFSIMNNFDSAKRNEIVRNAAYFVINPRYKKPITGKETRNELRIGNLDYNTLKEKCYALKPILGPSTVKFVVTTILEWTFFYGDKTSIDFVLERHKSIIELMQEDLEVAEEIEKEMIVRLIGKMETWADELPNDTEHWYSLYTNFCTEILPKLMEENIFYDTEETNDETFCKIS